ncbi:hypothetical protein QOZ80_3AG0222290 [Eleusine coracana subsp. coracana]|nr:hypothetical protein QOZ80_3AG0222290 [Eleusine coracana subsp. coracana]
MATMISVFNLLLLTLLRVRSVSATFSIMNFDCPKGSSYSLNSTYHSNVVTLLSSLSANASRSPVGFATGTLGAATSDQVWGLALCRGDISGSTCASCLKVAPVYAFGNGTVDYCRGVKDVSIYLDSCLLRFSGKDFLASPEEVANQVLYSRSDVTVTVNPGRFMELTADLIGKLSDYAAANNSALRYAAGVMTSSDGFKTASSHQNVRDIFGLVQCTPDQAPEACNRCLDRLRGDMLAELNGTAGGQVHAVWCNLRFEIFHFYESTPNDVRLVAPPPSPAGRNVTGGLADAATVIAIVLGVLLVAILASMSIIFICCCRKGQSAKQNTEEDGDAGSLLFDLSILRKATSNFAEENKLGHGGFGAVYKGFLPDGRQIAVKRLDKDSGQGLKELRNELLLVAKLRHNNLAKLLGVCLQGGEKLLVYEYLPNRSLDTFLFAAEKRCQSLLDWDTRYRIICGTARGLLYLHEDSQIKILHRDLKASNVLLDIDMNPKISDFGIARLFSSEKTSTLTSQVVGTLGYMAPEYAVRGHLSVKLDVYSFGVLVLEIVAGRRNTDTWFQSEDDESGTLLTYAWDQWSKGTPLEAMDSCLNCQAPESEVLKCVHLGLLCVQEKLADRPTMLDVLVMLHGHSSASFPAPSKPAFAFAYNDLSSALALSESRSRHAETSGYAVCERDVNIRVQD